MNLNSHWPSCGYENVLNNMIIFSFGTTLWKCLHLFEIFQDLWNYIEIISEPNEQISKLEDFNKIWFTNNKTINCKPEVQEGCVVHAAAGLSGWSLRALCPRTTSASGGLIAYNVF